MPSNKFKKSASPDLILHIDVDAFFASVEQLLIPALRNRPVIVGNGVIASCSYEARRFGLHAGMELHRARRLCPQVVILDGNYQIYRCFAEHIWQICRSYTCGLETYLDEAYGDAGGMEGIHGRPLELGCKLQQQVLEEVGLPVSVGLGANRMLAKIASSSAKPRGVAYIEHGQEEGYLGPLSIEKIPGIGPKTARRLEDMGIHTVRQLRDLPRSMLSSIFGLRGEVIYFRCRGEDVQDAPGLDETPPRTISRETTFHEPICDQQTIHGMIFYLLERAMRMARQKSLAVGCVELAIRYDDWKHADARCTLSQPSMIEEEVFDACKDMLQRIHKRRVSLRHVGITLSHFSPCASVAQLFDPPQKARDRNLCRALDAIRDRYGHSAVVSGESINLLGELEQNDYGFVLRTPSLTK